MPGDRADSVRDIQLMFLRGFFSGGNGSNRGYAARQIGPHGVVPFYNPGQSVDLDCTEESSCDLPLGGFTLWEASLELRYALSGPLGVALFADTSDVSAKLANFRFGRPHLSVGPGLRYDTPIGPVRLDIGYRVPGLQAPAGAKDEGTPDDIDIFGGVPIAISFGIGEAF
jgi:outer membrane protein insertion porin family/translocation and assembly module TamA